MADLLNRTLEHYRILEKLGEGGMGVVYLAEDTHLLRRVALKLLPPEMAREPDRLRRFQREAKVVAALNHPNIVTLHSVGEADGLRYLTMEYVEGRTLTELIPPSGFPLADVVRLALPLADALRAAHARGITHRDLKPGNIMVTPEGRVKILDFGLAKLVDKDTTALHGLTADSETVVGHAVGTLAYMAPEQLQGRPADARTDLFSLGAVLYELATGNHPFPAENPAELISAVLRDHPAALRTGPSQIPDALASIIGRCLEKSPDDRFQSAAALLEALQKVSGALAAEEILRSHRSNFGQRLHRLQESLRRVSPLGTGRRAALAALVVAGAIAAVAAVVWVARHRAAGPPLAPGSNPPAIAVLPLRNYTGEPEYFVDGMTDGLITALAKLHGARVISHTSAMHYKTTTERLPVIAAELGVDYIVEGSVVRADGAIRMTVQVVRAEPESTVWTGAFERPLSKAPALQNAVATAVGQAAGVRVLPAEETRLASARAIDPEAYQAYLQGQFYLHQSSAEAQRRAQSFFEHAIAKDPEFAAAYVGLADSLDWLASFYTDTPELFARADAAVRRAIELDDSLADAHATLGGLHLNRWEWAAAEKEIRRAVDLDPNSASARHRLWMWLACQRRLDEALREIELARKLDPLSAGIAADLGVQLVFQGRLADAERALREAQRLDPDYAPAHVYLWLAYHQMGKDPERGRELTEYVAGFGWPDLRSEMEDRLRREGYDAVLKWVAAKLGSKEKRGGSKTGEVAGLLAVAGQSDEAMSWLRAAQARKEWTLGWVAVSPDYESLRTRPDFQELLRALGLEATRQP